MAEKLTALILKFAGESGIRLSEPEAILCGRHAELMLEWNRRVNLTRITDPEQIVIKHVLDSILPARFLPLDGLAVDIGTGAGFPGLPLKIIRPGLEMTLLDSSRKKISFLAFVAGTLGLRGLRAVHGRWEDIALRAECFERFRLITMRAVRLEEVHLSELAAKTLAPGGAFAWWAGPDPGKEEEALAAASLPGLRFNEPIAYTLPGMDRQRSVWVWTKPARSSPE
ncbi:MAG: 16S rRNA (guanine(527)-N(7))-methyltransferase RsmG [Desulfobacteraceae bacterium]|nr:16S rRNA (guanine(527)-N(7))-methyltransferase RsmG [Desulfobacteraceae bacterium]